MPDLKETFLKAPEDQIDPPVRDLIMKWSSPATALELLETIDCAIYGSSASGFVVSALQTLYNQTLAQDGKTHADMVPLATWREAR